MSFLANLLNPTPSTSPTCPPATCDHPSRPGPPLILRASPSLSLPSPRPDPFDPSHFPSRATVEGLVAAYLLTLSSNKREKALVDQNMHDDILRILLCPSSTATRSAQFRFWAKKTFMLKQDGNRGWMITQEGRQVAVKERIYDVLVSCHGQASHGGRDKTAAMLNRRYARVPSHLLHDFVRACPTCTLKRQRLKGESFPARAITAGPFTQATAIATPLRARMPQIVDSRHKPKPYDPSRYPPSNVPRSPSSSRSRASQRDTVTIVDSARPLPADDDSRLALQRWRFPSIDVAPSPIDICSSTHEAARSLLTLFEGGNADVARGMHRSASSCSSSSAASVSTATDSISSHSLRSLLN